MKKRVSDIDELEKLFKSYKPSKVVASFYIKF
jgi:hypothetical protein